MILFEERQRAPRWLALPLAATVAIGLYGIYQQIYRGEPFGNNPMSDTGLIAFTVATALIVTLVFRMALVTRVYPGELHARLLPFLNRRIRLQDVARWEPVTYSPIRDFGGWGIRWSGSGKGKAYNMRGNRGVQLEFKNGKRLLIGSQRPEELAGAIGRAKSAG